MRLQNANEDEFNGVRILVIWLWKSFGIGVEIFQRTFVKSPVLKPLSMSLMCVGTSYMGALVLKPPLGNAMLGQNIPLKNCEKEHFLVVQFTDTQQQT